MKEGSMPYGEGSQAVLGGVIRPGKERVLNDSCKKIIRASVVVIIQV